MQYGPAFRLIEEVWVGEGESLCRLRGGAQGETRDGTQQVIPPAILDACFQSARVLRQEQEGFDAEDTYLPVAIEQIRIESAVPEAGDLFVQTRLVSADAVEGTFRSDIRLLDREGKVLVEVTGLEERRVARAEGSSAEGTLYSLAWVEMGKTEGTAHLVSEPAAEEWILFADSVGVADAMQESLQFAGGRSTVVRPGAEFKRVDERTFEVRPGSRQDLDAMFEELANRTRVPTAVVHLWTLGEDVPDAYDVESLMEAQAKGSQSIPGIVRAITEANWQNPPRLWLVTGGAMQVDAADAAVRIESAPMWGIGRMVAREHPELRATLVDLSAAADPMEARALALRLCAEEKEEQIALRGGARYALRVVPFSGTLPVVTAAALAEDEEYRIEIPAPGILDNLELRACARVAPAAGEVGIEVVAAGLNFIDVTKVMGIFPGLDPAEPVRLGIECVGRVIAVGEGVRGFEVGEDVIAVTPSARGTAMMASSVCVPVELVLRKPARLSEAEAATTAVAYLTASYSLVTLARIRRGDWVLIHAGAGGVGLAAIEIARWAEANVIATVGSVEKADYLRSLGVRHILDSRSSSFAAGVMEITEGRGVDIVLNSLAGELLSKGLEVLAPYGRFIELGKRDIYDDKQVGLKIFRKNLSFYAVDLAAAFEEKRAYVGELLRELMGHVASGEWRPLPVESFSSADPSVPFRYMAQARHIGRIAITMDRDVAVLPDREQPMFADEATYLITGGLGGVGLTVAEWMAENGAGHLVLLGRRAPSDEAAAAIRRIEALGTAVTTFQADITQRAEVEKVIATLRAGQRPLKGVMHAAAVVDDGLIVDLSPERFPYVLGPKMAGTWNLHTSTVDEDLEFFVLFSSIAAVHPQPGMGSYAAANAFLDAFAQYRRRLGKPASSVNWGGWNELGLAKAAGTVTSIGGYEQQGMRNMSGREALAALGHVLQTSPAQAIAVPFDWERFAAFYGNGSGTTGAPTIFSGLASPTQSAAGSNAGRAEILVLLETADSTRQRHACLETYLQEVLGRVLKLATAKIDRERPLGSMGLDSLMGLEFVRRLSGALEVAIPATVVFNYPTIRLLAGHLLRRMQLELVEQPAVVEETLTLAEVGAASDGSDVQSGEPIDDLSEEDALQALMGNAARSS